VVVEVVVKAWKAMVVIMMSTARGTELEQPEKGRKCTRHMRKGDNRDSTTAGPDRDDRYITSQSSSGQQTQAWHQESFTAQVTQQRAGGEGKRWKVA
jgi:hypothetical protein